MSGPKCDRCGQLIERRRQDWVHIFPCTNPDDGWSYLPAASESETP